jgi:hypothetical protein
MSGMKAVHYWHENEERWYRQYLQLEKICDELEQRVHELEQAIIDADKYSMPTELRRHLKTVLGDAYEGQ